MLSEKVKVILLDNGELPAFAWPGGYQMFYKDNRGCIICPACANLHEEHRGSVVDYDVNYENPLMQCNNCEQWINPSYLSDEEAADARRAAVAKGQSELCNAAKEFYKREAAAKKAMHL